MSNRILFARLEDAFKPGRHTLAVGQPRCLSLDTEIFWKERNDTTFKVVKLRNILHKEGIVKSFNFKTNTFVEAYALVNPSEKKQLYKITLKNGCTVKASLEHKFFAMNNGKVMEKELSELRCGDKLLLEARI